MTEDNDNRTFSEEEVLAEFRRGLLSGMQGATESLKAGIKASFDAGRERMERHFAAIRDEAELSRKLADMKLPLGQEQLLYSVLTLPKEALGLLREHLGIVPKQAN